MEPLPWALLSAAMGQHLLLKLPWAGGEGKNRGQIKSLACSNVPLAIGSSPENDCFPHLTSSYSPGPCEKAWSTAVTPTLNFQFQAHPEKCEGKKRNIVINFSPIHPSLFPYSTLPPKTRSVLSFSLSKFQCCISDHDPMTSLVARVNCMGDRPV